MAILIDGYNLLNATGVEGTGTGTELERARRGLLQFLASALTPGECAATTIVFDAQGAPPGLPNQETFRGITVLFSKGYAEADDLVEELIASDHAPRSLVVVSSDHRLHRAARRRRARAIDSDVWVSQLESRNPARKFGGPTATESPDGESVEDWLAEFSDIDVSAIESELFPAVPPQPPPTSSAESEAEARDAPSPPKEGLRDADLTGLQNPFPEGFGDELAEEGESLDDLANPFPAEFFDERPDS